MPRWLYFLLIFTVLAPILDVLHLPPLLIFLVAGLGILPLAALIGVAVEQIAEHTGERIGGLLFATFGNATELIIGILALSQGLVQVVSASIIGSIIANVLLVLGVSVCVGGFKHGRLQFDGRHANQYGSLLGLSIAGLLLPTVAELLALRTHQTQVVERGVILSDFIAVVLLLGYLASILFSVFRIGDKSNSEEDELDPVLGARSEAAIARLLSYRRQLAQAGTQPGKSGVLRQIDTTVDAIIEHETEPGKRSEQEGQSLPPATSTTPKVAKHEPTKRSFPWLAVGLLAVATAEGSWLSDILGRAVLPRTSALPQIDPFLRFVFFPFF